LKRQLPNAAPLRRLRRLLAAMPSGTPTSSAYLVTGIAVAVPLLTAGVALPLIGHGALEQDPGSLQAPASGTAAPGLDATPITSPAPDPSSGWPSSSVGPGAGSGSARGVAPESDQAGGDQSAGDSDPSDHRLENVAGDVGLDRPEGSEARAPGQPTSEPDERRSWGNDDDDSGDHVSEWSTATPGPGSDDDD
jgi:hypothetical protein